MPGHISVLRDEGLWTRGCTHLLAQCVDKLQESVVKKVKVGKDGAEHQLSTAGAIGIAQLLTILSCGEVSLLPSKRALRVSMPAQHLHGFNIDTKRVYPGSNKRRAAQMEADLQVDYYPKSRRTVVSSHFSLGKTGAGGQLVTSDDVTHTVKLSIAMRKKKAARRA